METPTVYGDVSAMEDAESEGRFLEDPRLPIGSPQTSHWKSWSLSPGFAQKVV